MSATKITPVEENITALCNEERPIGRSERDGKGASRARMEGNNLEEARGEERRGESRERARMH